MTCLLYYYYNTLYINIYIYIYVFIYIIFVCMYVCMYVQYIIYYILLLLLYYYYIEPEAPAADLRGLGRSDEATVRRLSYIYIYIYIYNLVVEQSLHRFFRGLADPPQALRVQYNSNIIVIIIYNILYTVHTYIHTYIQILYI